MPALDSPSTLVLASSSPRRAALVKLLGVRAISVLASNVDESFDFNTIPTQIVQDLALKKAKATIGLLQTQTGIVLGADTMVVIDNQILGKPTDAGDAKRMLELLSNATHTVFTGIGLIDSVTQESLSFVEATQVTFRSIAEYEIDAYIASGSPMDKAGSYGIQEDHGAVFVKRIDGDYYNVVGLPLCSTYLHLKEFAPQLF